MNEIARKIRDYLLQENYNLIENNDENSIIRYQDQVISIILAIVGLIIAYVDAKYPNTLAFLDNAPTIDGPEPVGEIRQPIILNEEYIEPIPQIEAETETNDDGC